MVIWNNVFSPFNVQVVIWNDVDSPFIIQAVIWNNVYSPLNFQVVYQYRKKRSLFRLQGTWRTQPCSSMKLQWRISKIVFYLIWSGERLLIYWLMIDMIDFILIVFCFYFNYIIVFLFPLIWEPSVAQVDTAVYPRLLIDYDFSYFYPFKSTHWS